MSNLHIWFRHNKPFRVTDNLENWKGHTFSEGDVVEEVYRAEDLKVARRKSQNEGFRTGFAFARLRINGKLAYRDDQMEGALGDSKLEAIVSEDFEARRKGK